MQEGGVCAICGRVGFRLIASTTATREWAIPRAAPYKKLFHGTRKVYLKRAPFVEHVLSCPCGKSIHVSEGAAGTSLSCTCGRTFMVPSLRELRLAGSQPIPLSSPQTAGSTSIESSVPTSVAADSSAGPPASKGLFNDAGSKRDGSHGIEDEIVLAEFQRRFARQIIVPLVAILLLLILLLVEPKVVGPLSIPGLIALGIFTFVNWRCPGCNRYLGRGLSPSYCPGCGTRLK